MVTWLYDISANFFFFFFFFSEEKLCSVEGTVPCKGYGECVMRKWIENGQTNCIDKSDQGHFSETSYAGFIK